MKITQGNLTNHNNDANNPNESEKYPSAENRVVSQQIENIEKAGTVVTDNDEENIQCITIIGQVEGHYVLGDSNKTTKYEHIIPLLVAIEENDEVDGLLVILNTMGGDVEAGLALAEMIASLSKPSVSLVIGGGHSIGIPLAVSAKTSFIVPTATMTVHPVRMNGLVIAVHQQFSFFKRMQDRIISFVTSHSRIKEEKFRELMLNTDELASDVGSIVDGANAVEIGLIDKVGGLSDALANLKEQIGEFRRANPKTKKASSEKNESDDKKDKEKL